VRKEHVAASPCDRIDGEREAPPRERVLTEPELVEIWTAAGTIGYPWGPFTRLRNGTGWEECFDRKL
jgi:hypothetical protein